MFLRTFNTNHLVYFGLFLLLHVDTAVHRGGGGWLGLNIERIPPEGISQYATGKINCVSGPAASAAPPKLRARE